MSAGSGNHPSREILYKDATVSVGQTKSSEVDIRGLTVVGLRVPADTEGTAITFESAEAEGGTFMVLTATDDAAITITNDTAAAQYALDPADFAGVAFVKVVVGASITSADAEIDLVVRPLA